MASGVRNSQRVMCSLSTPSQVLPRDHLLARVTVIAPRSTAVMLHIKYQYCDINPRNDCGRVCALRQSQSLTQYAVDNRHVPSDQQSLSVTTDHRFWYSPYGRPMYK